MSRVLIAQFFVAAALVLIVVHRWVANRWLNAHLERYRRLPDRDWWKTADRDPLVERWRRWRLVVFVPMVVAFATAITLLITAR